jgi:hypothetical protein
LSVCVYNGSLQHQLFILWHHADRSDTELEFLYLRLIIKPGYKGIAEGFEVWDSTIGKETNGLGPEPIEVLRDESIQRPSPAV